MLALSAIAQKEKNKLSTDSAFLILLDIELGDTTVHICYNTDDIVWNGNTYIAFPFEIGETQETTDGSDPTVELKISNVSKALQYEVEHSNGGNGTNITMLVVNSENLNSNKAEIEESYAVKKCSAREDYITFTIGCEYSARTRRPLNRYMKNNCPFKYKGIRCGYNGDLPECKHTLMECRAHNNSKRFGGFSGIDQKGVYSNA